MKVHSLQLTGRSLCSIRSNRKWCKRRGSSLQCQNCFFVYSISDCNLKNLLKHTTLKSLNQLLWNIQPITQKSVCVFILRIHGRKSRTVEGSPKRSFPSVQCHKTLPSEKSGISFPFQLPFFEKRAKICFLTICCTLLFYCKNPSDSCRPLGRNLFPYHPPDNDCGVLSLLWVAPVLCEKSYCFQRKNVL